jgi:hypothetical protein
VRSIIVPIFDANPASVKHTAHVPERFAFWALVAACLNP